MAEPAVVAHELVKRFGSFTAVDRLSFEIQPGEIFGFLGPNGSGKSTTIRMLCGLLWPTSGDASVAGISVAEYPERVRERLGYMSQQFSLYGDLTVYENMEFYGGVYGIGGQRFRTRAEVLLERLSLGIFRDRLTMHLSTGVRQRLALACALIHEPPVLFLDEPTSGVDPVARRGFFELIGELSRSGVTTLITTHVMDEAEHCNRLVLIHHGQRVALGRPAELKAAVGGELLAVQARPTMEAADALEKADQVLQVSLFGTALHVAVAGDVPSPEDYVRGILAGEGMTVEDVRSTRPTLEHAFLSLASDEEEPA